MLAARLGHEADGFFVGNLGLADQHINMVIAGELHPQNFQVQFAHAGDDGLAGLVVVVGLEGRIFALERGQSLAELLLVGGRLGLD